MVPFRDLDRRAHGPCRAGRRRSRCPALGCGRLGRRQPTPHGVRPSPRDLPGAGSSRRGGAFWFGFSVLGWAAFVLVLDALAGSKSSDSIISRLPLLVLEATVDRAESSGYGAHLRNLHQFHILHLMLILPVGLIGGVVGWWCDRRRRHHAGEAA